MDIRYKVDTMVCPLLVIIILKRCSTMMVAHQGLFFFLSQILCFVYVQQYLLCALEFLEAY